MTLAIVDTLFILAGGAFMTSTAFEYVIQFGFRRKCWQPGWETCIYFSFLDTKAKFILSYCQSLFTRCLGLA